MPDRLRLTWVLLACALGGCQPDLPPSGGFYEARIDPILSASCARTTSGCHLADERGSAAGNLDVSSYDALRRRTDALVAYGPYPRPLLLLKVDDPQEITVDTHDPPDPSRPDVRSVVIRTDIRHGGSATIPRGSRAFAVLSSWLDSGYARTGAPVDHAIESTGACSPGPGSAPGFSPDEEPSDPALFDRFVREVEPVLVERCAASSCHGAALADLHLSCGTEEAEQRWNYFISVQELSSPADRSELLRRPLAIARGGTFHGGGDTFPTTDDPGYRAILGWAEAVVRDAPQLVEESDATEGYRFFVNRVEPTLVRKGCMMLACHSPISAVFNLRGGAGGAFSRFTRRINYDLARSLLAIESPDPNQSRIIRKNLFATEGGAGMAHRGGSLLEDFLGTPAEPRACDGIDADHGDLNEIPAYCVMRRWHQIEREAAVARGELESDPVHALVWVARPPGIGEAGDFDTYRPGADLRIADASLDSEGALSVGASRSLLESCDIDRSVADVRTPAASFDGSRVVFAVRARADRPLRLWSVLRDGTECAPLEGVAPLADEQDGILLHDFDPAFAPDGRLVFASTRGLSHGRPTRTPASLAPNADLYVLDADGSVRQLTFLLNQELAPAFMQNGRVIYTVEKRELDFHMLALRRQNLDGGDYHPLYASRRSLGFASATEVEQLPDQNFVFVAAPLHAPEGAGSIAIVNRSIGPDQEGRDDRGYLHSLRFALRSMHDGGRGLYRSPWPLPTGRIVLACAPDATDATNVDFDVCELEPRSGALRRIAGEPGVSEAEVVALSRRLSRGVLASDGRAIDHPVIEPGAADAEVHFNDFVMIQTLMFRNTRTGRPMDRRIGGFEVLVHRPPPAGTTSFDGLGDRAVTDAFGSFYAEREVLGWVPLYEDGSTRMRLPGGLAISYRMTDEGGAPLDMQDGLPMTGPDMQREHEQYYPGERIQRSISRRFFNDVCGACHGSISGRELDVGVSLDVITGASENVARDAEPFDVMH